MQGDDPAVRTEPVESLMARNALGGAAEGALGDTVGQPVPGHTL